MKSCKHSSSRKIIFEKYFDRFILYYVKHSFIRFHMVLEYILSTHCDNQIKETWKEKASARYLKNKKNYKWNFFALVWHLSILLYSLRRDEKDERRQLYYFGESEWQPRFIRVEEE